MLNRLKLYKFALAAILLLLAAFLLAPYFAGHKAIMPIAFSLGSLTIHWYGITMAGAILICSILALKVVRPKIGGLSEDQLLSAFVWIVGGGLIGARLLFVMLKWHLYAPNPISALYISEGGLSLHGALLGGLLAILIYSAREKLNWKKITDIVVVTLPIGQAIGRFGNFFNQEAFGGPTSLPWKMFVSKDLRPPNYQDASFFHPTFLYEALLLVILYIFLRKRLVDNPAAGQLTAIYLGGYSIIRFITEFFRIDSDHLGTLSIAQWASLAILIWSILWYYRANHDA